jgi:hypothetical protein
METTMKTQQTWIFGLAVLGLAVAAPVQAAPNYWEDAFIVARDDRGDDTRYSQEASRNAKKDRRGKPRDEAEREEPQGYGYGYERRQRERIEEDSRSRGRR